MDKKDNTIYKYFFFHTTIFVLTKLATLLYKKVDKKKSTYYDPRHVIRVQKILTAFVMIVSGRNTKEHFFSDTTKNKKNRLDA